MESDVVRLLIMVLALAAQVTADTYTLRRRQDPRPTPPWVTPLRVFSVAAWAVVIAIFIVERVQD